MKTHHRTVKKPRTKALGQGPSPYQRPFRLTKREKMLLDRIWLGAANQDIANEFNISVRTVEAHRAMIMRKFGVNNVAQLLRSALLSGALELK